MKALILAAGKATRLKPITDSIAKCLLPVANKPILFYCIEQIRDAGINDIGIVISQETGFGIRMAVGDGHKWNVKINYIIQSSPQGLAHAVKTARDFLGDSPFLLFLGDNLIKDGVKDLVTEFNNHSQDALIVLKRVLEPRAYGVVETNARGQVTRVVEKPKEPKSDLALVGVYIFHPVVHQAISKLKPSYRGEYEITDAIQILLETGKTVRSYTLKGWWLDTGKKEDLLEANRLILNENQKQDIKGELDALSDITFPVEIKEGTKIENSHIKGPVSIAECCRIIKSSIGPHSSIGPGCTVENSTIESSIIMENSHINNNPLVKMKIISKSLEI
jgi:glucose-1-phosphate thymidylyltransferase